MSGIALLKTWFPHIVLPLIVCAPMRLAAGAELAAVVHKEGGLGFLGLGYDMTSMDHEMARFRTLISTKESDIAGCAGFICWGSELSKVVEALKKNRLAAVWLFAPENFELDLQSWIQAIRQELDYIRIFVQVGSVNDAVIAVKLGADVIVAQGSDAGGHGYVSSASIVSLVPEVIQAILSVSQKVVPVIAAGGIVDGTGVAAALALGASGAVMGTRYALTEESAMPQGYKECVLAASDGGRLTIRNKFYDFCRNTTGWPKYIDGRSVINDTYLDHLNGVKDQDVKSRYKEAEKIDDFNRLVVFAGTGVGLIRSILPASEVTRKVREDAKNIIRQAALDIA
ncbi:hypothetical protein CANCADRAFT_113500 [Tortispora caseinolytica NRRL Y-17796]|uniref:Uncharacterized protein n=1 Tax=Tortispora caseinolytica NRRL Y-17796 TaxID=767744 RepID=A0A1E4TGT0_9ASCO|nr:hypothetical protein CANCADRAFT_113500 [Tortispora caseinolytica NRRL Y-17796]